MATTQIDVPQDLRPTLYPHRDPQDVLRRLSAIDLLRALPAEEVQELVRHAELLRIPPGVRFIDEGAAGDALYFIETGTARVERRNAGTIARVSDGSVIGEMALLSGTPRNASVYAETELWVWRIGKGPFDELVARSQNLRHALEDVAGRRAAGVAPAPLPSRQFWVATALHAIEARSRGIKTWQAVMAVGFALWVLLFLHDRGTALPLPPGMVTVIRLLTGLLILQGACEAFLLGVERLGARLRWDGFIAGTIGSLLSTLPEFVVIAFLVSVDPFAAFVTGAVTVFNNALIFSLYSFFLPKDRTGAYAMPRSVTAAGGELLIAGGAIALIVGLVMIISYAGAAEGVVAELDRFDVIGVATILIVTFVYYVYTLMQYYSEGLDDRESVPPDPRPLGYSTALPGILSMFGLGVAGAYCGGEAIGGFAESALSGLGWPAVPTAAMLAFFAGISEIIIVYKSHRRGELGVALSNAFGGLTQVMFLLLPFSLMMIGILGLLGGGPAYVVPINVTTMLLMVLLFPVLYALHQYLVQEKQLTNLDAVGMTGIYLLLLYFLFTSTA